MLKILGVLVVSMILSAGRWQRGRLIFGLNIWKYLLWV
jgi:hypothetical protein